MSPRMRRRGQVIFRPDDMTCIRPKCAPDVILLNLGDELSFFSGIALPDLFFKIKLKIQVLIMKWRLPRHQDHHGG